MTRLGARLLEQEATEQREALRALLSSPLLLASRDEEAYRKVARHRDALARWFEQHTGWRLRVEPEARFARLYKVPHRRDGTRPLLTRRGQPFDRRRYVLLCLACAALDDIPGQTTLTRIAERVRELSADEEGVAPFDAERIAERRALVDVLTWLSDCEVLRARDGDTERYARSAEADVLYDVNERVLGALLASPRAPSSVSEPAALSAEVFADTAEGERRRARQGVFRALLEDPVVYNEDLPEASLAWLQTSRAFVYERMERDVGLVLEKRREGLAAIDPSATLTDLTFPDGGSTLKHAALLLAEQLAEAQRRSLDVPVVFPDEQVEGLTRALLHEHGERCSWADRYVKDPDGARRLADDAMALLAAFLLVRREAAGWMLRAAIARFLPAPPDSAHGAYGGRR